ncbi:hypothetical protein GQR58_009197 [Nymphon striatum]|nr:hypothetical protein GQR58_009197 [Nymphon striatum]
MLVTGAPAPDVVLELMSCKCPRRCNENCPCVVNGFSCTPACKLLDCDNMQEEDESTNQAQSQVTKEPQTPSSLHYSFAHYRLETLSKSLHNIYLVYDIFLPLLREVNVT